MRLIDADALKPTNAGLVDAAGNFYGAADFVFLDDIKDAPTVDPVKHGEWILEVRDKELPENFAKCSICNFPVSRWWGQNKYCPNCGAKMNGYV